jgi:acyl transferase domain-containing protein
LEAGGVAGRALPTLTRRPAGGDPFLIAAARCHVAGYDVSTGPLFDGPAAFRALPHYPWQRERAWFTRSTEATDLLGAPRVHPLLGFRRGGDAACWFNHVDLATQPWIGDHVVAGTALLPAAAMIDMALAACAQSHPEVGVHELWDVEISRPVGFEPGAALELGFSHDADGRFTLFSRARRSGEPATAHATGRLSAGAAGAALTAERAETAGHTLDAAAFYALTGRLGLAYGPTFRSVRAFGADGPQSGWVEFGEAPAAYAAMIDPLRLDGALQGLAALVALGRPHAETACVLPVRFGRVRLLAP